MINAAWVSTTHHKIALLNTAIMSLYVPRALKDKWTTLKLAFVDTGLMLIGALFFLPVELRSVHIHHYFVQ